MIMIKSLVIINCNQLFDFVYGQVCEKTLTIHFPYFLLKWYQRVFKETFFHFLA